MRGGEPGKCAARKSAGHPQRAGQVTLVTRPGSIMQGIVHFAGHGPEGSGVTVQSRCLTEISAPFPETPPRVAGGKVTQPVPQQRCHAELGFTDHGLGIYGSVVAWPWAYRGLRPGQDVQEMEVGVDQYIRRRAPAYGSPCLANFQGSFQQPPRKGPAQLFPFRCKVIAPTLGKGSHMFEFGPFGIVVWNQTELADQATPDLNCRVHGCSLQRADRIKPLQQHCARSGVGIQQADCTPPVPQGQGMPLDTGFVVRIGHLEHCGNAGIQYGDNNGSMAVPGLCTLWEVKFQVPVVQPALDQAGK